MSFVNRNWIVASAAAAGFALGCLAAPVHADDSVAGWAAKSARGEFTRKQPQPVPFPSRGSVLNNGTFEDAAEQQLFIDYYTKSVFPNVTNEENRQSQNDVAVKLHADLVACKKPNQPTQVFDQLADITLDYMTDVARDAQYHPAARVNAIQVIGEVESPKAAKALLDLAFKKGPLFVRVAAMDGLIRMAGPSGRGMLASDAQIPKDMARIAGFSTSKASKAEADGINWMRGQSADVLAELGNPGDKNEVAEALLKMLSDKDVPIPLRSKAAKALGKLRFQDNAPAAGPYLTALAEFARDAVAGDQPPNRARVRQVLRDIEEARNKFRQAGAGNQAFSKAFRKALTDLDKDTQEKMNLSELKAALEKAKDAFDEILK